MSGCEATEHICGVVGVIGVIGVFGVVTRLFVSSVPPSSRDLFGTRPYRTAEIVRKMENQLMKNGILIDGAYS